MAFRIYWFAPFLSAAFALTHMAVEQQIEAVESSTTSISPTSTQWGLPTSCDIAPVQCFITESTDPVIHVWYPLDHALSQSTFVAYTIATVVNTVEGSSRVTTIWNENVPNGFELPKVDEHGTVISTITYIRSGVKITSTLAYPTPWIEWPESYSWWGTLTSEVVLPATVAGGEPVTTTICLVNPRSPDMSPVTIVGNPQPTDAPGMSNGLPLIQYNFETNLYSSGYRLSYPRDDKVDNNIMLHRRGLFPDHLPMQQCSFAGGKPSIKSLSNKWLVTWTEETMYEVDPITVEINNDGSVVEGTSTVDLESEQTVLVTNPRIRRAETMMAMPRETEVFARAQNRKKKGSGGIKYIGIDDDEESTKDFCTLVYSTYATTAWTSWTTKTTWAACSTTTTTISGALGSFASLRYHTSGAALLFVVAIVILR